MKQLRFIIIVIIVLAAGAFIWITAGTDPETLLMDRIAAVEEKLVLAGLLLSALILLSTLTGLPVFYLSLAMGFLLPFFPALIIAILVNLLAVMGTFYMVRFAFKAYFQEKYDKKKLVRRINKRIRRYGIWTVVFSRAIYILPTNVINFSFPLSKISPKSYLLGTLLGLLPECLINVGSGYLLRHEIMLLASPEARTWQALAIGSFVLLFALVFILLRIRQLRVKKFRHLKAVPYRE